MECRNHMIHKKFYICNDQKIKICPSHYHCFGYLTIVNNTGQRKLDFRTSVIYS